MDRKFPDKGVVESDITEKRESKRDIYHIIRIPKLLPALKRQWKVSKITLLMIIMLVSVLVIFVLSCYLISLSQPGKSALEFDMECHLSDEENYIVEVGKVSRRICELSSYEYYLRDGNGNALESGDVLDILGLDPSFSPINITFIDRDLNGNINKGDYFILRSMKNGGIADDGMRFILDFSHSGETMSKITLGSDDNIVESFPSARWEVKQIDKGNISFDTNQAAIDRSQTEVETQLNLRIVFDHIGTDDRNISISAMVDGVPYHLLSRNIMSFESVELNWVYNVSSDIFPSYEDDYSRILLSLEILDSDTTRTLLLGETSIVTVHSGQSTPSFSSSPLLISFAMATVFLTAIGRTMRKHPR